MNQLPGTGNGDTHASSARTGRGPPAPSPRLATARSSPGYFRVLGMPLLGGRAFGTEDARGTAPVVMNRALQRRYFPGEDAIGKRIRPTYAPDAPVLTIVGVVGDQTFGALDEARPAILYFPDTQSLSNPVRPRAPLASPGSRRGGRGARSATRHRASCSAGAHARPRCSSRRRRCSSAGIRSFLLGVFAAFALSSPRGHLRRGLLRRRRAHPRVRRPDGGGRAPAGHRPAGAPRRTADPSSPARPAGLLGSVALATLFRGLLFGVAARTRSSSGRWWRSSAASRW